MVIGSILPFPDLDNIMLVKTICKDPKKPATICNARPETDIEAWFETAKDAETATKIKIMALLAFACSRPRIKEIA
eukprot:CAMPEP_0172773640 /NCGR_PEP_ID=MMETSP1074-20121228/194650_1 /TAXON_ID=2916 /ORGANISM="Ceratium fusus, Strain PA161109" /LENGTH=75 /DNA_ID=CAMNT_0013609941 /DNA_START=560 /DNA_END=787 /DNA_ORIENTATION=+